jgi:prolyl 4-hydroxylase
MTHVSLNQSIDTTTNTTQRTNKPSTMRIGVLFLRVSTTVRSGWRICGTMAFWLLFLVVLMIPPSAVDAALAVPRSRSSGGGFGKPATTTTTTNGPPYYPVEGSSSATKQKKKSKKNRLLLNEDDERSLLLMDDRPSENPPLLLDKWGLPPPTLDDIFPPLPIDTKLVPAKADHPYDLDEIHAALQDYIDLDLSRAWEVCNGRITLVYESPPVLVIDDFLTADECREIQQVAGLVAPSGTTEKEEEEDDESSRLRGRQFTSSSSSSPLPPVQIPSATMSPSSLSIRTSTSWFCHYAAVSKLLIKMEHLLGLSLSNIEEPQIVRYQSQQQFSWHYDHLPIDETSQNNKNGGQRLATVLVYLNDCIDAPTVFRDLRGSSDDDPQQQPLAVAPVTGRALIFFPAYKDGRPDERTLHRGMPVADDDGRQREKLLVQCWIHASAYREALPPNNRQEDVDRIGTRRRLGYE